MKLWLWKNFVDGKPEYWAFDNPFPIGVDHDDPQTLGEPCGYAIFKPSRKGRTDVSEEEVLRRITAARGTTPAPLTDEQIDKIWDGTFNVTEPKRQLNFRQIITRAIELAHGIRGTT